MTAAQAQTTCSAGIGAGYTVNAVQQANGSWNVFVQPGQSQLDLKTISDFAVANGLTGNLQQVVLK